MFVPARVLLGAGNCWKTVWVLSWHQGFVSCRRGIITIEAPLSVTLMLDDDPVLPFQLNRANFLGNEMARAGTVELRRLEFCLGLC